MDLKVKEKLPRPPYFRHMEEVNLLAGRPHPADPGERRVLAPRDFQKKMKECVVIDTRSPEAFAGSHIHGSYNVWLEGLSTFGGWLATESTRLLLVVDQPKKVSQAIASLQRPGPDGVG